MTLLTQEIDHSNLHPAIESSESVVGQAQGDPFTSETSEDLLHEPTDIPKPNKNEHNEQVLGSPFGTYQNGCKNSKIILGMQQFLNTKTHTRVLLMNHLKNL